MNVNRIVLNSRVGADGVLQLAVPFGAADADREVQVTIEPARRRTRDEQNEWRQFVIETAGAWQGDLERPAQGEFERRDELP